MALLWILEALTAEILVQVRDSDVEGMSDGFDNGTAYGEYNQIGICVVSLMVILWQVT